MLFGADYYPEHWPKERWEKDAELMRKAGINVVRLAEFAWALLEPGEGVFDFSWLDEAIDTLARQGIKTILGTPTAAPPKWLVAKYPDSLMQDQFGHQRGFGSRRHYCYNNPSFRHSARNIINRMALHYQDHPHIVAWQIDNEFGCHDTTRCYCKNCLSAFHEWLKDKYISIDNLNKEWGTVFWSQIYEDWHQIDLPAGGVCHGSDDHNHGYNPSLLLDFYRFSSDSVIGFQKLQINEIRKYSSLPITHNCMGFFHDIDYYKLGEDLDVISWDNYPTMQWRTSSDAQVAFYHDLMRGVKNKDFWVMEQQSGPCGWSTMGNTPRPGQLRLWTHQSVAHGAEAIVYFRWRSCLAGTEQYWHGILDHDGIPRRRYEEIKKTGSELQKVSSLLLGSRLPSEVAIIHSYDNHWSHSFQKHWEGFDYQHHIETYYGALHAHNIPCDIIPVMRDLSFYKLVILPACTLVNKDIRLWLEAYVNQGGHLLLTFRSGVKTWNNAMTADTLPGQFKDLCGLEIYEFDCRPHGVKVPLDTVFGKVEASCWCEVLKPHTAKALAYYRGEYYDGKAAITENAFGQGRVYYVGCHLEQEGVQVFMEHLLKQCGIQSHPFKKIKGVEVIPRTIGSNVYYYLLNHNSYSVQIHLEGIYADHVNGTVLNDVCQLEPYGVAFLSEV